MSKITLSVAGFKALNDSVPLYQLSTITNGRRVTAYFLNQEERDRLAVSAAHRPDTVCICRDWTVQEVREAFEAWDRLQGSAPFESSA